MAIEDFELVVKPKLSDSQSLVGEVLPEFDDIEIDFAADKNKDKAILVCFFDMNQRPSRNALIQLNRKSEGLKQKNVTVIAIQIPMIDDKKLNNWILSQSISLPVGVAQSGEEEVRFNWGVKSLPWMILTNSSHVVQAEGFSLNDLDSKIDMNE
jgi:hypothetical protein